MNKSDSKFMIMAKIYHLKSQHFYSWFLEKTGDNYFSSPGCPFFKNNQCCSRTFFASSWKNVLYGNVLGQIKFIVYFSLHDFWATPYIRAKPFKNSNSSLKWTWYCIIFVKRHMSSYDWGRVKVYLNQKLLAKIWPKSKNFQHLVANTFRKQQKLPSAHNTGLQSVPLYFLQLYSQMVILTP